MNPAPGTQGFWSPSPWYLAQAVHVLAGAAVMLAAHVHGWPAETVWLALGCVTFAKEFFVDTSAFEGDSVWGSTQDFLCYQLGAAAGALAPVHFGWAVGLAGGSVLVLFLVDLWRTANWHVTPYD